MPASLAGGLRELEVLQVDGRRDNGCRTRYYGRRGSGTWALLARVVRDAVRDQHAVTWRRSRLAGSAPWNPG